MKTARKKKLPVFKSDAEEARFWDTHDSTDYLDDMEEVHDVRFAPPRKRVIALRLDPPTLARVKAIAQRRGVAYTSLIRTWIAESARREAKKA